MWMDNKLIHAEVSSSGFRLTPQGLHLSVYSLILEAHTSEKKRDERC